MSQAVAALVLHPKISQALKVWSTTVGRDKTYRAVQYFARFFAWFLLTRGEEYKDLATRWSALKSSLATGRKMMRLFKPMEHIQAALRASIAASPYRGEQFTTIARQVAYAGYLSYDMFIWLNAVKFLRLDKEKAARFTKISQRFWFVGIVLNVANSVLKLQRLNGEAKQLRAAVKSGEKDDGEHTEKIKALRTTRASTRRQLTQDMLDIWLPASGLGLVNINDGTAGLIGLTTSIMALQQVWAK
jgi:peroxin-11B